MIGPHANDKTLHIALKTVDANAFAVAGCTKQQEGFYRSSQGKQVDNNVELAAASQAKHIALVEGSGGSGCWMAPECLPVCDLRVKWTLVEMNHLEEPFQENIIHCCIVGHNSLYIPGQVDAAMKLMRYFRFI